VLAHVKEPYAFETVPIGVVETVLGAVEEPAVTLTEVEKVFFDEIDRHRLSTRARHKSVIGSQIVNIRLI